MSEVEKRKVHTPEFKAKVGLEALRGQKTINDIAREFGVHPVMVRRKFRIKPKRSLRENEVLSRLPHTGALNC